MLPSVSFQKLDLEGLRTSAVPDGWGPAGCDMRRPVCCTASKQRTAYRPATCHPQGFRAGLPCDQRSPAQISPALELRLASNAETTEPYSSTSSASSKNDSGIDNP